MLLTPWAIFRESFAVAFDSNCRTVETVSGTKMWLGTKIQNYGQNRMYTPLEATKINHDISKYYPINYKQS